MPVTIQRETTLSSPAAHKKQGKNFARLRGVASAILLASLGLSCQSAPEEDPKPADLPPAVIWQESILDQLATAWQERDLDRMDTLLGQPRVGATSEQSGRFETYETLLASGRVKADGFTTKGFVLSGTGTLDGGRLPPDLEVSELARIELQLKPAEGRSYRVAQQLSNGAKTRFILTTRFEDWRVDGSVSRSAVPYRFAAQRDLEITTDEPFVVALPPLPSPPGDVLMRKVRVEGSLLCANFSSDGRELALPRIDLDAIEFMQFLKGFRTSKVRSDPLAVLKVAVTDPGRFGSHLLTASWFLARDFDMQKRQEALPLLIEALRGGTPALRTMQAALLLVAGDNNAPEMRDRDGWLRWWDLRAGDGRLEAASSVPANRAATKAAKRSDRKDGR